VVALDKLVKSEDKSFALLNIEDKSFTQMENRRQGRLLLARAIAIKLEWAERQS